MKRKLLLLMLIPLLGLMSLKAQTCLHSVELSDSYGDGWNGGTLTITVNGSAVLTNITLASGTGPEVYYFDAATGDDIDADYTAGDWSYENEYTVKDGGGTILGQSGQGGTTPVDILNMVGNCPSCPPPTGQTESNITTTTADLGWTTGGATTWDIEWGVSGFTPATGTTITGTTNNPYSLSGLTLGTSYDWYVRDDCGGGVSDWAGPHTFTTLPGPHGFPLTEDFESGFTSFNNATGNTVDWVLNTSIYHGSTQSAHNPYTTNNTNILHETGMMDLSGTSAAILEFWQIAKTEGTYDKCYIEISTNGGSTYTALPAGSYQGAGTGYATAGYFDEDDYSAWGTGTETPDNTWWRKETFSLASYTTTNVRFRFRLTSDGSAERAGWYLDDIYIYEPSCPAPTALTSTNETTSGADLAWTDASGSHWDLYIVPSGDPAPDAGSTPTVNDHALTSYTWSGGTAATTYDWYVRSDCGANNTDVSTWTGPDSFTTMQVPAPVQSMPYSEDWETGTIGSSWNYNAGSVSAIMVNAASLHAGSYGLSQYGNSSTGYVTPSSLSDAYSKAIEGGANANWTTWNKMSIDLTSATNPLLSFWYSMGYLYNNAYNNFWVQVSTDGTTWTDLFSTQTNGSTTAYEKKEFYLSAYNGSSQVYVRFFHNGKYAENFLYLDDISINDISCPAPTNLISTNETINGADLAWTDASGTHWDLYIVPAGDPAPTIGSTPTINDTQSNPYTWSGGSSSSAYDWYVRSDCGQDNTDVSNWAGPGTFTTVITCPEPIVLTTTNITSSSADLGWTESGSATTWNIEWGFQGFTLGTGTQILATTNNPYSLTAGLSPGMAYEWYVQASCGIGDESLWSGPEGFSTEPSNDDCSNAVSLPVSYTENWTIGTNVGATESNNNPDPIPAPGCASYSGGDVWYTATVPASGYLVVTSRKVVGSPFLDSGMGIYTGTCGSLLLFECDDDDSPDGLMSQVIINDITLANATVYIRFWEYGNNLFGMFEITAYSVATSATWAGTTDNDWHTASNWNVAVPGTITDVTIPAGLTNYPTLTSAGSCNNLTIESSALGNGSLMGQSFLTVNGTTTIECYTTAGTWHGIAGPLDNDDFNSLYFGGSPDVWGLWYNE
ncbi:MAG: hypothetical protein CO098_08030, partial [Bacteroidetes bacterium CG_4_9_14_3_um_filter_41_19]